MVFLWLMSVAMADIEFEPCFAITSPGPDSGLFPIDGHLAAAMVPCLTSSRVRLTLAALGGDGTPQIIQSSDFIYDAEGVLPLFPLVPDAPLESGATYVFSVISVDGLWPETSVQFQTMGTSVVGVDAPPSLNGVSAIYYPQRDNLTVRVNVTPAADPNHLSLVHLIADGNESYAGGYTPNEVHVQTTWSLAAPPDETCFTVGQIDGRGIETTSAETCAAVEVARGCSTIRTPTNIVLAALALALLRRRR